MAFGFVGRYRHVLTLVGTHTTVSSFVDAVDRLGHRIAAPNLRASEDAGAVFGELVDRAADRSGATSWAGMDRPKYRTYTRRTGVIIRPGNVGAVVALNDGTDPHIIGPRRLGTRNQFRRRAAEISARSVFAGSARGAVGRVRNARGSRALKIGGEFSAYAFHPGMSGFGFISDAMKKAPQAAAETWLKAKRRELLKGGR